MEKDLRPVIGITMGDPAGNGPEISVKALTRPETYEKTRPVIVGDARIIKKAAELLNREDIRINAVDDLDKAVFRCGTIDVFHMDLIKDPSSFRTCAVSVEGGNAAFQCVRKVIELALSGKVDATCTNALNKEAMNLALETYKGRYSDGHTHFDGNTEIYAAYTCTKRYTMMLAYGDLRVVHVSTHCSLREACDRVKKDRVLDVIKIAYEAVRDLGIERPRIAVAGLNPHSGENGLFGMEEIDEIIPAVREASGMGMDVTGPVPPDSVFPEAAGGLYDIVVAMYHDQGHIPVKTLGFEFDRESGRLMSLKGVNVTLGLPIIRTSVDHGTGFPIAWKGISSDESLVNAIDYAVRLYNGRRTRG